MPRKKHGGRPQGPRPLYKRKPPQPAKVGSSRCDDRTSQRDVPTQDFPHGHVIPPAHFELREDGSIVAAGVSPAGSPGFQPGGSGGGTPHEPSGGTPDTTPPRLAFHDASHRLWLYQGNCLELLDAIYAQYGEAGRFDCIFADPPYFLSNGGITCHAGRMVKVDKGDWDKSRGPALNHEFNLEWLRRCQRVLKPNGTLWVSGTHHVIFSIGYALQQLGFKLLNDIAWEKPNPPPNLSCRYFTHSTETLLWAAKNEQSRHVFNYQEMRRVTGKQMKTVWRASELGGSGHEAAPSPPGAIEGGQSRLTSAATESIWTIGAPGAAEKAFGKHPTQKPVALVERCLLAATHPGDLVLDPFLGGGTTCVAAARLKRGCVGIEADDANVQLALKRLNAEIVEIWLRHFRVEFLVAIFLPNDLDLFAETINGSRRMAEVPQIETERIYHETKFVFLSCAEVQRGTVVHTTVDVSLQEAWAKTPTGKKRETTHIVRCETEIFRVKSS